MADIDLPTLVQRIRVDTSQLDRAERVARAFGGNLDDSLGNAGDAADDYAKKADGATRSTKELGDAHDDSKVSAVGAAAAVERLGESTRRTSQATQAGAAASANATGESERLRLARLRLAVANNDVLSAEQKLNAAHSSGKTDEQTRGEARLAEALLRRAAAEQEVTRHSARNDPSKAVGGLHEFSRAADKAGNASSFLARMMGGIKVPALVAGLSVAVGGLGALAAAAVAAVGALGPLIGVLGSLPAALGALATTKGVFTGLIKGPAEAAAAVNKAADATTSSARTIKNANRAVADASRRASETQVRGAEAVADARRASADAVERAADNVKRAEENLARAQEASKRAQEDLTRARDNAREKLQDMALSVRQAALDEEAGRIALAKARERLDKAKVSGDPREIQEADLAYRQQVLTLDTIIERNDDLATEAKKAQKQGVEGSDEVVAAQKNVVDTQAEAKQAAIDLGRAQRDSARMVADAQRDLARTIRDTAQANADAQRAVQDAKEAAGAAGGGGQGAADAMKDLTPAGRKFAEQLLEVKKRITEIRKEAQGVALPGLTSGLKGAMSLMPSVRAGYLGIAGVIGKTGKDLGALASSGPFGAKFAANVASNTRIVGILGGSVTPLVKALNNVMYAARGMSETFARAFGDGANKLAKMSEDTPRLEKFFARTTKLVFTLARQFRDFGIGLKNIASIGASVLFPLNGNMERTAASFRKFTESADGKNKIRDYFLSIKPALDELRLLARDVAKGLGDLSNDQDLAALIKQIRTELLPAFTRLAKMVNKNVAPTIIKLATAFLDFQGVLAFSPIIAVAGAMAEFVSAVTKVIAAVPGLGTVVASLLAFKVALKGVAVAGKITGVTGLVSSLSAVGPAGAAGQKGLAGFVQGLKGVDKAGNAAAGRSTTIANKIGGAFRAIPGKVKGVGSSIASTIGKGITASKSIATSAASAVSKASSAVVSAGAKVGSAAGKGIATGLSRATAGIGAGLSKLGPVLAAARTGLVAAAGAAKAFTMALLTNPIFLVIAALVALGIGLVALYKHSETFRDIVNASWKAVQAVVGGVVRVLQGYIKGLITVWTGVIKGGLAIISGIFKAGWTLITGIIKVAVGLWLAPIKAQFALIKLAITTALKVVKALFKGDFDKIPGILTDALKGVWTIFSNFGKDVLSNIGDLGKTLFNAGKALIQGLIDGIQSIGSGVYDAVKGKLGPLGRLVPGSPIKEGPLKGWNGGTPGKALVDLIAGGITAAGPRIPAAMKRVLSDVDLGIAAPDLRASVPSVRIPAPPVPSRPALVGSGAPSTTTIDNSRHYDVDVHETTGPTTEGSLTRRLRALDGYGHAALSGRTG